MKNWTKHLFACFFTGLLLGGITPAFSQSDCYIQLDDASGFDISPYQDSLDAKACELVAAFPDSTYADSFKVYGFGFYVELEYYDAYSYPQAFLDAKEEVASLSPYYLLIGRQSDPGGLFSKFWVDVKLPFSSECIDGIALQNITDNIRWTIEDKFAVLGASPFNYSQAEESGINYLKNRVEYIVQYCCNDTLKTTCLNCPDDLAIQRKLLEKEFIEVNIDSFNIGTPVSLNGEDLARNPGLVDAGSEIIVYLEGAEWNLNNGLNNELSSYPMSNIKGVVASNIDMCMTDLYLNLENDFYNSFDLSVIYVLWTREDPITSEIIDKKLYFKEKFPTYPSSSLEAFDVGPLGCHPQFGIYNSNCNSYPLPTDVSSLDSGKYFISTDVNGHFHGYRYDGNYYWDELTKTEYLEELPQFAADRDDMFSDCNFYDYSDYSDYAKRQSGKSTKELIKNFERWTKNNVFVGLDDDLKSIIDHYYFKNGETLEWSCNSQFSKYIYSKPVIQNSLEDLELIIADWLISNPDLDSLFVEKFDQIKDILGGHPSATRGRSLPGGGESSLSNATAAIAIGGFQGHEFKVSKITEVSCSGYLKCYEIEITFTIIDIFGAGTTDRDRGGPWNSQIPIFGDNRIPGLTEMWLLQHCRNQNSSGYNFIPFEHRVHMGHTFKVCIP